MRRTLFLLALLTVPCTAFGQCAGGSCALPSFGGGFSAFSVPRFSAPPAYAPPATYRPASRVVYSTAAPQVYELSDGHGTLWSHSDPVYLRGYVAGRKAALESAAARVTLTRATPCQCNGESCTCVVPGDCGRPGCAGRTPPTPPNP
jgi:hypothetical protein